MGGICIKAEREDDEKNEKKKIKKSKAQEQVYEVDIVKAKLKTSRDRVNNIIKAKNNDISRIDSQIKELLPEYQETGNKKKLVPLLKAKKDLETFVDSAQVRVKLLNEKLSEVEMQQVNADTINALEDSNKYIKQIQDQMEKKDWQGIVNDAKNKYELDWPQDEEQLDEDPAFQAMWEQLGGNKLKTNKKKNIQGKNITVEIPKEEAQQKQQQLEAA